MKRKALFRAATMLGTAALVGVATTTSASAVEIGFGNNKGEATSTQARAYDGEYDGNGVYVDVYTQNGGHYTVWDGNGSDGRYGPWSGNGSRITRFRVCEDRTGCGGFVSNP
ncbi:hypothetical protein JK361_32965 [Streptomyces sp. 5-8]|uniref:Uncharacterized protein n=1 Tax=Streptomyces musisoli TaxID=2802280 RepID=A0ABS1PBB3_9ACTN|nr:hypothetical protein [Streptomyces musisoli]MBL1109345.1 hypothetical protein [Streptomyces musisoli]